MSDYEGRSRPPAGARTLTEGSAESGALGKHTLTESHGAPVASGPGKSALTQRLPPVTAAPDQEFVAQWVRANVRVGNKEIQAIQEMPPEQREVLMIELKRRYGHEYVQRGVEGKLDDSAPAARSQQRLDATEYWAKYGEKTMLAALQRATSELEFEVVGPGLSFSPDERSAFVMYGFGWRINETQPHIVSQLLDCPLLPLIDSARVVDDDQRAADAYEPAVVERILERLGLGIRRATERLALPYAKARARAVAEAAPPTPGAPPVDPAIIQPSSQALGARTTIEHGVADGLCSGAVAFDPIAFGRHPDATTPGAEVPGEPRPCRLELARGRGDWMTAHVLEPAGASAADVAAELYGNPQFAHLVVGTGDLYSFVFPPGGSLAEPYETQWTNRLLIDEGASGFEMSRYRVAADPVLGLDGALADQRALDSAAGRVADGYGAAPVLQRLEIMASIMDAIAIGATPLGVAPIVQPMQARLAARRDACTADPAEAERWAAHSSVQLELLTEARAGIDAIAQQMAAMGAPGRSTAHGDELAGDVTASMQAPTREVTAAYAGVVAASDQLDVGRERLALANERMAAYPFDMVDRMLVVIRGRIAATSNHATIPMQSYDRQRLDALETEIAGTVSQLRMAVINGDGTAPLRLHMLRSQLSMLDLQSALGSTVSGIHELKGQVLASESMHPDWQRRDRIWDRLRAAIGPWYQLATEYDELWQAGKEQDPAVVVSIRARLAQLRATTTLPALVAEVTSFAEDEAERQRWIAIGIMIGAALVSAVSGGLASSAIGGVAGALIGAGLEGLTFTAIVSTLQRDQTFGGFMAEVGLNVATFAGLRAISGGAKLLAGGAPMSLGAKLGEMTLEALWVVASVKAQEEIDQIFKRGGSVTTQSAATVFGHQFFLLFATRALARVTSVFVEGASGADKVQEVRAALALRAQVAQLAQQALDSGNDTLSEAFAKTHTAAIRAEVTAVERLREIAANPAEAARLGITLEAGALEKAEAGAHRATHEIAELEIAKLMDRTAPHGDHIIAEPAVYSELLARHGALGSRIDEHVTAGGKHATITPTDANGALGREITLHLRADHDVEKILAEKGLPNTSLVADYLIKRAHDRAAAISDLRKVTSASELDALLERTLGKEAVAAHRQALEAAAGHSAPPAPSVASPDLVKKLTRAGIPDVPTNPNVAKVLRELDQRSQQWLEELLDLEASGRVRGIRDWFATMEKSTSPEQVRNMLRELREARRLVNERPSEIIDVGGDARAPLKPVNARRDPAAQEIDSSFDIETRAGSEVAKSVEVKTYEGSVLSSNELMKTVEATTDKVSERRAHGQPIAGELELRIDIHLYKGDIGKASKHGGYVYRAFDGDGNYSLRHKQTGAPILDAAAKPKGGNIFDDMVGSLNNKPKAKVLSRLLLVDEDGILAVYKNEAGIWMRIQ